MDTQKSNDKQVILLFTVIAVLTVITALVAYGRMKNGTALSLKPTSKNNVAVMNDNDAIENPEVQISTTQPVDERADYIATQAQLDARLSELENLLKSGQKAAAQAYVTLLRKDIATASVDAEVMFKEDLALTDAALQKMENGFKDNTDTVLQELETLLKTLREQVKTEPTDN